MKAPLCHLNGCHHWRSFQISATVCGTQTNRLLAASHWPTKRDVHRSIRLVILNITRYFPPISKSGTNRNGQSLYGGLSEFSIEVDCLFCFNRHYHTQLCVVQCWHQFAMALTQTVVSLVCFSCSVITDGHLDRANRTDHHSMHTGTQSASIFYVWDSLSVHLFSVFGYDVHCLFNVWNVSLGLEVNWSGWTGAQDRCRTSLKVHTELCLVSCQCHNSLSMFMCVPYLC